mmetsp:Transcript_68475/g.173186  ORF Transcript_68475/g.173186 Transcript_68475/m.173186 type:complete len:210 (+) Transcript_68475:453-1082(+)
MPAVTNLIVGTWVVVSTCAPASPSPSLSFSASALTNDAETFSHIASPKMQTMQVLMPNSFLNRSTVSSGASATRGRRILVGCTSIAPSRSYNPVSGLNSMTDVGTQLCFDNLNISTVSPASKRRYQTSSRVSCSSVMVILILSFDRSTPTYFSVPWPISILNVSEFSNLIFFILSCSPTSSPACSPIFNFKLLMTFTLRALRAPSTTTQ